MAGKWRDLPPKLHLMPMQDGLEIVKNNEGIFRVRIHDTFGFRYLTEADLSLPNQKSLYQNAIINCPNFEQAQELINLFSKKNELLQATWVRLNHQINPEISDISDTFMPLLPNEKITE